MPGAGTVTVLQPPLAQPELQHVSQQFWLRWNNPLSLVKRPGPLAGAQTSQQSQAVPQLGAAHPQLGVAVPQLDVAHPQLPVIQVSQHSILAGCSRAFKRASRLGFSSQQAVPQVSQQPVAQASQQPVAMGATVAGVAGACLTGAPSAPASHMVVTTRNAAFTLDPPL